MSIQTAAESAARFLSAEPSAIDVEMEFMSLRGVPMYAIFNRDGIQSVSESPRSAD